jgi:FdhD protein
MNMAERPPVAQFTRLARRVAGTAWSERRVPEEVPVALSFAGTTHAVMMASPADLEDFALGFALTEGIIGAADEIERMHVEHLELGIDIQMWLHDTANTRFKARRRMLAGPVGCGLCGIESIDEAVRPVSKVSAGSFTLAVDDVGEAMRLLAKDQPFHAQTGAVHAAGFFRPGKGIALVREDVGRHNALDKLAGALSKAGIDGATGAIAVTSRLSVEMVQKAAATGASAILAVSAPTALAIRTAEQAGMTLIALVRGEEFDVFTHPERVNGGGDKHVA